MTDIKKQYSNRCITVKAVKSNKKPKKIINPQKYNGEFKKTERRITFEFDFVKM